MNSSPTHDDILTYLSENVALYSLQEIVASRPLKKYNLDSIDFIQLASDLELRYDVRISDEELSALQEYSLDQCAGFLADKMNYGISLVPPPPTLWSFFKSVFHW